MKKFHSILFRSLTSPSPLSLPGPSRRIPQEEGGNQRPTHPQSGRGQGQEEEETTETYGQDEEEDGDADGVVGCFRCGES